MEYPEDWPDGCPPDDTEKGKGEIYRLVKSKPPTETDFLSHHETGKMPKRDPCLRCGLSVFRNQEDAEHQYQAYPKLGKFVSKGTLKAEHGVTKLTSGRQPSHTTWWPYKGVNREVLFTETKEIL